MRTTYSLVSLLAGMIAGAILLLSCGDDTPGNADAATCDCSAAEPALAGRIMIVSATRTIDAGSRGGQGTACPQGALRLSGSCTTDNISPIRDVTLEQAGFDRPDDLTGWDCLFRNNEATPVTVKVQIVCLMPPSS